MSQSTLTRKQNQAIESFIKQVELLTDGLFTFVNVNDSLPPLTKRELYEAVIIGIRLSNQLSYVQYLREDTPNADATLTSPQAPN